VLVFHVFISFRMNAKDTIVPPWELSCSATRYQKGQLQFTSGSAALNTRATLGFEFDLLRRFKFKNSTGIAVHLGTGRVAYQLRYAYAVEEYPELEHSIFQDKAVERFMRFRRFALAYEYYYARSKRLSGCVSVSGGVRYLATTLITFESAVLNSDSSRLRVINFRATSFHAQFAPDAELKLSGYYALGKRIRISASLFYRHSFQDVLRGNFTLFPDTVSRTTGTFRLSGSCAGFSIGIGI
jgi:hypothetical protein